METQENTQVQWRPSNLDWGDYDPYQSYQPNQITDAELTTQRTCEERVMAVFNRINEITRTETKFEDFSKSLYNNINKFVTENSEPEDIKGCLNAIYGFSKFEKQ